MKAVCKDTHSIEGFTIGKEYEFYDMYNVGTAKLSFHIKADDNGRRKILNERLFTMNFLTKRQV